MLASNVDPCCRCALSAELQYTKPGAFLVREEEGEEEEEDDLLLQT